jgi:hypothetical protein
VVSQADGEGLVVLPCDLSARCSSRGASLCRVSQAVYATLQRSGFVGRERPLPRFGPYAAAGEGKMIGPWDDHCPQATRPWSGSAD